MATYDKDAVKERIEIEDVYNLLEFFGAEPQMFSDYITAKTICHGGDDPNKLWYYNGQKLFHCYTGDCGTFDIFELVQKVEGIEDFNQAIFFVVNFFNLQSEIDDLDYEDTTEDWKIFKRYNKINETTINKDKIILPEIPDLIKYYPSVRFPAWEKENISKELMDYMGIKYDPVNGAILIPHRDIDDRLIGIRQRTLIQEQEEFGKYRPAKINGKLLNHPLSANLYGLNIAKNNIKRAETAIVLESEKAAMQAMGYLGIDGTIAVGMCGSNLSKYQFQLLLDSGAKEICIGLDKDFHEPGDEDFDKVVKKLESLYQKYSTYVNISFLFDKENLLGYKCSPTDISKEIFFYLWRNRVVL